MVLGAVMFFTPTAASAAAVPPTPAPPVTTGTIPGDTTTHAAGSRAALTSCPINRYGYDGYRICEFESWYLDWGGGNVEYFVVGTDYAIWHIWQGSGGWHSLGGQAQRQTPNGAYTFSRGGIAGVWTWGTDGNPWCRNWPWTSGWYRC